MKGSGSGEQEAAVTRSQMYTGASEHPGKPQSGRQKPEGQAPLAGRPPGFVPAGLVSLAPAGSESTPTSLRWSRWQ